jgi:hypothetical protein
MNVAMYWYLIVILTLGLLHFNSCGESSMLYKSSSTFHCLILVCQLMLLCSSLTWYHLCNLMCCHLMILIKECLILVQMILMMTILMKWISFKHYLLTNLLTIIRYGSKGIISNLGSLFYFINIYTALAIIVILASYLPIKS